MELRDRDGCFGDAGINLETGETNPISQGFNKKAGTRRDQRCCRISEQGIVHGLVEIVGFRSSIEIHLDAEIDSKWLGLNAFMRKASTNAEDLESGDVNLVAHADGAGSSSSEAATRVRATGPSGRVVSRSVIAIACGPELALCDQTRNPATTPRVTSESSSWWRRIFAPAASDRLSSMKHARSASWGSPMSGMSKLEEARRCSS